MLDSPVEKIDLFFCPRRAWSNLIISFLEKKGYMGYRIELEESDNNQYVVVSSDSIMLRGEDQTVCPIAEKCTHTQGCHVDARNI